MVRSGLGARVVVHGCDFLSDVRYSKYQRTMEGMGGLDGPGYSKGLVGLEGQYNKLRSVLKVRAFRGSGRFREVPGGSDGPEILEVKGGPDGPEVKEVKKVKEVPEFWRSLFFSLGIYIPLCLHL